MSSILDSQNTRQQYPRGNLTSEIALQTWLASLALDNHPQSSFIRDLAWSLLSPQLIDLTPEPPVSTPSAANKIWQPRTIQSFISQYAALSAQEPPPEIKGKNALLGQYFESLIEFYLSKNKTVKHLLTHQKLYQNKRTLGEFDYLYRAGNETEYTHLEVTVKFFLYLEANGADPQQSNYWVGLNPRDSLAKKIDRMRSHQLCLSQHPAAKDWFHSTGIEVCRTEAIFRGRLFYPWQVYVQQVFSHPECLQSDHLKGWWLRQSALDRLGNNTKIRLQPLERFRWLAVQATSDQPPQLSYSTAEFSSLVKIHHRERPLMLARWTQDESGRWQELDRGVLTPDHWPVL